MKSSIPISVLLVFSVTTLSVFPSFVQGRPDPVLLTSSRAGTWEPFKKITIPGGLVPTSGASLTRSSHSHIDMFFRDQFMRLIYAKMTNNGNIISVESLGGNLIFAPFAVSPKFGEIEVIYQNLGNYLHVRSFREGKWLPLVILSGRGQFKASLVVPEPGTLTTYVSGPALTLWNKTRIDGKWQNWIPLGIKVFGAPSTLALDTGKVDVFTRNFGNVWQRSVYPGGGKPQVISGALSTDKSAVAICSMRRGKHAFLARGDLDVLRVYEAKDLQAWTRKTSPTVPPLSDGPACLSNGFYMDVVTFSTNALYISKYYFD